MKNKLKILVIEDEPLVLKSLNDDLLTKYEVLSAMDGKSGLNLIKEELPDLVLLDLLLPKMHGLKILEKVKSNEITAAIPIVILSQLDDKKTIKKGLSLGASDYLVKQEVNFKIIHKAIEKALKKK